MAKIIDGAKIAQEIKNRIKKEVGKMESKPKLVVIQVGNDPASLVYVGKKAEACWEVGIESKVIALDKKKVISTIKNKKLCLVRKEIKKLNEDASVSGILVQLPLPKELNSLEITALVDPKKDVDCLCPVNVGKMNLGIGELTPCTPKGCLYLLKKIGIKLMGKNVVIIGRSNIVGKPLGPMLMQENATVTNCHLETGNLGRYTRHADILISAAGEPRLIKKEMVKKGAVVIDVGITREKIQGKNRLVGDVDFSRVKKIASYITPVPGGVGPMTVAMLLENTLICHKMQR